MSEFDTIIMPGPIEIFTRSNQPTVKVTPTDLELLEKIFFGEINPNEFRMIEQKPLGVRDIHISYEGQLIEDYAKYWGILTSIMFNGGTISPEHLIRSFPTSNSADLGWMFDLLSDTFPEGLQLNAGEYSIMNPDNITKVINNIIPNLTFTSKNLQLQNDIFLQSVMEKAHSSISSTLDNNLRELGSQYPLIFTSETGIQMRYTNSSMPIELSPYHYSAHDTTIIFPIYLEGSKPDRELRRRTQIVTRADSIFYNNNSIHVINYKKSLEDLPQSFAELNPFQQSQKLLELISGVYFKANYSNGRRPRNINLFEISDILNKLHGVQLRYRSPMSLNDYKTDFQEIDYTPTREELSTAWVNLITILNHRLNHKTEIKNLLPKPRIPKPALVIEEIVHA